MFKEYIARDNEVFFNENEFAERICINNIYVPIIIDNDRLKYTIKTDYQGLVNGDVLFFIKKENLKIIPNISFPPSVNEAFIFNQKNCVITNITENNGVYEIIAQFIGGYQNERVFY